MKDEVWKPVKGYEGFYEVSNKGRVRSVERRDARGQLRKSKIMSVKKIQNTKKVTFFRDGKSKTFTLKKLVAGAFLEAPKADEKLVYIDGNPDNICAENLKWQKKAQKKHNIYRFEDNKTGEVFEGSISECCDEWRLTKSALLNRTNRGSVTKTLIGVKGLRTFTNIETGDEFYGTKQQALAHFNISWSTMYDKIYSGLIKMFPEDEPTDDSEDKISDPKTKRLLNQYYVKKANELGVYGSRKDE
ncbi:NUMOD4 domain-containing protein [uncultured Streptococcus sp.]|uniref:NUMOD4 domain-containing protein n=1 Tax=uncultured Streptococcus sp. TaxID=83427 RepID=UPI00259853B3|nr:NUMOD4 domain-containing protein [uncultured Streptococcus sp.]